ncbi:Sialate O-acetylesterase domain [Dillenia turbinata]|uniref:Sialate O-acetylesterase domain n=1 Tax=Dillenia turbinata TaxID=194707 RepID=A0AAN8W3Y5_9MAGN
MLFCFVPLIFLSSAYGYQYKNIIILAGQSNMSGRGGGINETWDWFVPPESKPNPPSVLRLSAGLAWLEAEEPLHKDIDINMTCGVGPAPETGPDWVSALRDWRDYHEQVGSRRLPIQSNGKESKAALLDGGTIRAILWHQGESDTLTKEEAGHYRERLERFIDDVRSDLQLPTVPFILVALASAEGPYIDMVRGAQLGMDLPNVQCVDAKGLALEPAHLHLSTSSQVKLGEMLGDAFLRTTPSPLPNLGATKSIPHFDFQLLLGSGPLQKIFSMSKFEFMVY